MQEPFVCDILVLNTKLHINQRGDRNMKKLYDVKLTFDPKDHAGEVKSVAVRGEFLFYRSNLTGHTDETGMVDCDRKYTCYEYEDGMDNIGGVYVEDMSWNEETRQYEVTLRLPAGLYPYSFVINPEYCEKFEGRESIYCNVYTKDGEIKGLRNIKEHFEKIASGQKGSIIPDPKNMPDVPTVTGSQHNSQLIVGDCTELSWLPIKDRQKAGTVSYMSYKDINGDTQSLGVYLPSNYSRDKVYRTIYVSHGGGGNEADWFHQGGIANIMDNLIAEGKTEEAILVTMNNSVYKWDFEMISQNMIQCVIPFIEKLFPVYTTPDKRAFCGLSMGSMTTLFIYMHHASVFDYYGAFSGGMAPGHAGYTLDDPHLKNVKLLIGCAEEDIAYNEREIGVPPTIRALRENNIPFRTYFTTGSHDWFCWPQMFEYFAAEVLWK